MLDKTVLDGTSGCFAIILGIILILSGIASRSFGMVLVGLGIIIITLLVFKE